MIVALLAEEGAAGLIREVMWRLKLITNYTLHKCLSKYIIHNLISRQRGQVRHNLSLTPLKRANTLTWLNNCNKLISMAVAVKTFNQWLTQLRFWYNLLVIKIIIIINSSLLNRNNRSPFNFQTPNKRR